MARYIDAEKAMARIREERKVCYRGDINWGLAVAETFIYDMPTEDVAPVVHAHWIQVQNYSQYMCSACGGITIFEDGEYYCSNCGAKMDEEIKEEKGS